MKNLLFLSLLWISANVFAQPKPVTHAIISTTTNFIVPENDDAQNIPTYDQGGNRAMNFRNLMDGEIKSTTYLKDNMVKTVLKSDMGRSTIIRDNDKKLTTTIMEIMGTKTGFYITDEEQVKEKIRRDSIQQSKRKNDSSFAGRSSRAENPAEIVYTQETKKMAGFNCKKAYIVSTRLLGVKDTVIVWYTPEIKLSNLSFTGGLSGFVNMPGLGNMEKLDGFVMAYEINMRRNRKMQIEVTKVELEKEIANKEFDIPKDIELKPMKEMANMFGGMSAPGGQ